MTLPSTVRVLGLTVKVSEAELEGAHGTYQDKDEHTIQLDKRGTGETKAAALLHELIHVVDVELRLGLKEKTVARLAAGLFQTLRDNPELVTFLCGGESHETRVIEVDRTPNWIKNAKVHRMYGVDNENGPSILRDYIHVPDSGMRQPTSGRADGVDPIVSQRDENIHSSGEVLQCDSE